MIPYIWILNRVGERGPNPRFSPSPSPNFGDGAGMGTRFGKILGIFRGRGEVKFWVFLGFYPRKSPKYFRGNFGDGDKFNFGDFWVFFPEKTQILGNPRKSPFYWWILRFVKNDRWSAGLALQKSNCGCNLSLFANIKLFLGKVGTNFLKFMNH